MPVPNQQIRIATSQGETFVVACGNVDAPPLLLLHGSAGNSVMWIGDVAAFAARFRVYALDMIGEAGLSAPSRPPLDSDAYAQWLDEVLNSLSVDRVSIVGISLGGWLALDYAIRRRDRVARLAVLCPGGVGRQKLGILFAAMAFGMCGVWGRRRLAAIIFGRQPANLSPAGKAFMNFIALIHEHFRPHGEAAGLPGRIPGSGHHASPRHRRRARRHARFRGHKTPARTHRAQRGNRDAS